MASTSVDRNTLYSQVWAQPMTKVAATYGITGTGLKKICDKLDVPVPPRGHWAKLAAGKKVVQAPLPEAKPNAPTSYDLAPSQPKPRISDPEVEKARLKIEAMRDSIVVHDTLRSPHPLVALTRDAFKGAERNDYGRMWPNGPKALDISVSPGSLRRALCIMDAIVKAVEKLGLHVQLNEKQRETFVEMCGVRVAFRMEEPADRSDHKETEQERKEKVGRPWFSPPRWDYTPSGRLLLRIGGPWHVQGTWSDRGERKLESHIPEFLVRLYEVAIGERAARVVREEQARQYQLQRQREIEEQQARVRERQRLEELEEQASRWARSRRIREYVAEVERQAGERTMDEAAREKCKAWVAWAREQADRLDPTGRPTE